MAHRETLKLANIRTKAMSSYDPPALTLSEWEASHQARIQALTERMTKYADNNAKNAGGMRSGATALIREYLKTGVKVRNGAIAAATNTPSSTVSKIMAAMIDRGEVLREVTPQGNLYSYVPDFHLKRRDEYRPRTKYGAKTSDRRQKTRSRVA